MSTSDQPETPQLTRKQLRELRNTGVTPVITDPSAPDGGTEPAAAQDAPKHPAPSDDEQHPAPSVPSADAPTAIIAPLPRAAEPVVIPPAPSADASVDLGTAPLTRRQVRQQERIRTASVPVITPELAAVLTQAAPVVQPGPAAAFPVIADVPAESAQPAATRPDDVHAPSFAGPTAPAPALPVEDPAHPLPDHIAAPDEDDLRIFEDEGGPLDPAEARATVSPALGAGLLNGKPAGLPAASFDQLLHRDTATSGSVAGPSTLIVSQSPSGAPLVAPVAATGEVIVTGTWVLPEGMGSTGHAPGTTDGKDLDAALIDGELPTHSSPTPIAASAAVSTAGTPEEIITPPAPEKGNKLMLTLAVTAGVLAVALIGVLVFALSTGVFK